MNLSWMTNYLGYLDFGKLAKEEAVIVAAEDSLKTVATALFATTAIISTVFKAIRNPELNSISDRHSTKAVDSKFRKDTTDKLKSAAKKRSITILRRKKTGFENIKETSVYKIDLKQEKIGKLISTNPLQLQLLQLVLPLDTLQDTRTTRKGEESSFICYLNTAISYKTSSVCTKLFLSSSSSALIYILHRNFKFSRNFNFTRFQFH